MNFEYKYTCFHYYTYIIIIIIIITDTELISVATVLRESTNVPDACPAFPCRHTLPRILAVSIL